MKFPLLCSSHQREAVGHRPPVFPDHHDEDGPHQAHGVYGVSEKVSVRCKSSDGDGALVLNAANGLSKWIQESVCLFFFFHLIYISKIFSAVS